MDSTARSVMDLMPLSDGMDQFQSLRDLVKLELLSGVWRCGRVPSGGLDVRNGYHVYWWEVPTAVGTSVRDNVPVMYTQVSMAPGTEVGPRSVSETDRRASVGRTLEKLHDPWNWVRHVGSMAYCIRSAGIR